MTGSQTTTSDVGPLHEAYPRVCDRIAEAASRSGRSADAVKLIAVTKYASPDQIRSIVSMGQEDLGESRVQQLQQRVAMLDEFLDRRRRLGAMGDRDKDVPQRVRWHMIGSLQRNKVKAVVPLVYLIHSVENLRLAEELQAAGQRLDQPIDILLQVNASGEASKQGVAAPAAIHLAEQIDTMLSLRLRGIMTMAPFTENPETVRHVFARCAELFHEIKNAGIGGGTFNVLSMGMSNDFEVAIEEGANVVRVGRALFGDTPSE